MRGKGFIRFSAFDETRINETSGSWELADYLLRETLRCYFPRHGACLNFLAQFLIALFRVKTINLAKIATGFMGSPQADSPCKRLRRFFRDYALNAVAFAQAVILLMALPQP